MCGQHNLCSLLVSIHRLMPRPYPDAKWCSPLTLPFCFSSVQLTQHISHGGSSVAGVRLRIWFTVDLTKQGANPSCKLNPLTSPIGDHCDRTVVRKMKNQLFCCHYWVLFSQIQDFSAIISTTPPDLLTAFVTEGL